MTTDIIVAENFLPAMTLQEAAERRNQLVAFVRSIMVNGIDYGTIPGAGDKPTLLQPGAEKLSTFFGLSVRFKLLDKIEDWTGKDYNGEPFFYFRYACQVWRSDMLIVECEASCNSMEKRYRYRWVQEHEAKRIGLDLATAPKQGGKVSEMVFAVEKSETTGKYGKPSEYWQAFKDAIDNGEAVPCKKKIKDGREFDAWEIDSTLYRAPNPDIPDQVNTIQKQAQKRAFVSAIKTAVNGSEFFTQDIEDMADVIIEGHATVIDEFTPIAETLKPKPKPQAQPKKPKLPAQDLKSIIDRYNSLVVKANDMGIDTDKLGYDTQLSYDEIKAMGLQLKEHLEAVEAVDVIDEAAN